MPSRLDQASATFDVEFEHLLGSKRESAADVQDVVSDILADVRARGDAAVIDLTDRFDRLRLTPETLRFSGQEIAAAKAAVSPQEMAALTLAADRIHAFHLRQKPEDAQWVDADGVTLGYQWRAVEAAGLYVPGGRASYPSSVLMNAIPARVAGVDRLVMCVPTPGGEINPLVLAAADLAGVDEIYRVGGAQAIGAMAYGTATITPVDVIVGPGNAYVAAAKRMVFGTVGIDMIAGPSEILVVADNKNDPDWIAADLMSQAEHDEVAQAILITDDAGFADQVEEAVSRLLTTLSRGNIAAKSWADYGSVIIVDSLEAARPLVDRLAPEHVELAMDGAQDYAATIRNAGAIFMGRHTPEAIGDYVAGPNHVLPTARSARFSSALSVLDFMKRSSLIGCDAAALAAIGPAAITLARSEGLGAHALSVSIRLDEAAATGLLTDEEDR